MCEVALSVNLVVYNLVLDFEDVEKYYMYVCSTYQIVSHDQSRVGL